MKKILAVFCAWLMIASLVPVAAHAQSTIGASRVAGVFVAANYNYGGPPSSGGASNTIALPPSAPALFSGNPATGTATITVKQGYITLPDGRVVFPFCAGSTSCGGATPITVNPGGSNQETVTPTAVSGCNVFPQNTTQPTCQITASFSNLHAAGEDIQSGSAGLQEAANDAGLNTPAPSWSTAGVLLNPAGNVVVVDGAWSAGGGTQAMLAAAVLGGQLPTVAVMDYRLPSPQPWKWLPSAVALIAAPSAPTLTTTTGSLSSGAYKGTEAYVDCMGGISLDSSESAATATTTGVVFPSPAATAGACGWLPRLSTAGGSANEILAASPLTSSICTLSKLVTTIPVCAIGASATITAANPSSTAKPSVEANAFTTFAAQPVSFSQASSPVVTNFPFGIFVVTGTLNASNADGAQIGPFPAGYFNKLGGKWRVCPKTATATETAGSLYTINLTMAKEYAQSPVTIASSAFPTQTQAGAGTQFGCWVIQTAVTGSSGKFWVSTPYGNFINFANAAVGTQVIIPDATTGNGSAIDLTKQIYLAINLQAANANNITGPIVNSVTVDPEQ